MSAVHRKAGDVRLTTEGSPIRVPESVVGSIRDQADCERATSLLADRQQIGAYIRGTCGLWADGHNSAGIEAVHQIKGEKQAGRPLSTNLGGPVFVEMLDSSRIDPSLHELVLDPERLADPQSMEQAQGSFPIVRVGPDGIRLLREGRFPARLFEGLMGQWPIDLSEFEQGKYSLVEVPDSIEAATGNRELLRERLISFLDQ